jgi:plasmid stability protein
MISSLALRAAELAMTSLSARNLDDDLILRLKRRAAWHGHSAEAEARDIQRRRLISTRWPWNFAR